MTTRHVHTPLEAVRESALLTLAGAGILLWAPVLFLWTSLLMLRDRIALLRGAG
jgi:hypothetical protein